MKIDTQTLTDHRAQLTVEFDPGDLDEYKRRTARELARRIKVPGFRPGKAPYHVIVRQVGEPALLEEALEKLVNDRYEQIITESGISPYTSGHLEKIVSSDPLVLEFQVPLAPVVELGDYHSIHRDYELALITDEDVDEVLENLQDRQAILEPAERPARPGDVASVHLSGERVTPAEDQPAELIQENTYQFLIRTPEGLAADEWPFPGFSQRLLGLSSGEGGMALYTFPEDYGFENLRGVEASYQFTVEAVKSRTLPELNDEFAKSVGEYESLESLRADILASLQEQRLANYNEEYDDAILDELVSGASIQFPAEMLESEQNTIIENFKRRLEGQGTDFNLYLKSRQINLEALKEEAKPAAEKRLQRSLALLELSKAEDIQLTDEEIQTETAGILQSLNRTLEPEEARRLTDPRMMNNLVGNVMLDLLNQRALQRLRDIARGNYPPASEETSAEAAESATEDADAEKPKTGENVVLVDQNDN